MHLLNALWCCHLSARTHKIPLRRVGCIIWLNCTASLIASTHIDQGQQHQTATQGSIKRYVQQTSSVCSEQCLHSRCVEPVVVAAFADNTAMAKTPITMFHFHNHQSAQEAALKHKTTRCACDLSWTRTRWRTRKRCVRISWLLVWVFCLFWCVQLWLRHCVCLGTKQSVWYWFLCAFHFETVRAILDWGLFCVRFYVLHTSRVFHFLFHWHTVCRTTVNGCNGFVTVGLWGWKIQTRFVLDFPLLENPDEIRVGFSMKAFTKGWFGDMCCGELVVCDVCCGVLVVCDVWCGCATLWCMMENPD